MTRMRVAALIAAAAAAALVAGCAQPSTPSPARSEAAASPTADQPAPVRIQIPRSGKLGIFDPAPVKDPASARVWMSYSSVEPSNWSANRRVSTRLAHSDDGGKTWSDDGPLKQSTDVTLPLAAPNNAGTWEEEVSRLAYDANAPVGQRWVLLWMRYLEVNGVRHFDHTWIGMRTAASPSGPWSAPSKQLVGAAYPASDDTIQGKPIARLADLSGDLSGCVAATEPGILSKPEGLYVSLYCAAGNLSDGRQILLMRSRDHGKWRYVGTLATNSDAQRLGYDDFSATELAEKDGKQYLIVSPEKDGRYRGCMAFEVADLKTAKLNRSNGALEPALSFELNLGGQNFGGACGYSPGLSGGLLYSELFGDTPPFRMYASEVDL